DTSQFYPLSLHDALPIYIFFPGGDVRVTESRFSYRSRRERLECGIGRLAAQDHIADHVGLGVRLPDQADAAFIRDGHQARGRRRSEEHTSELQSQSNLVC